MLGILQLLIPFQKQARSVTEVQSFGARRKNFVGHLVIRWQPSTGPTPGGSKVPYLIMIVILILVTSASLVLLHMFVGYKNLTESTALLQKSNAETLRDNECNKKFCYSKSCLQMASRTLQLLNSEADPCTDFYEYSCGGYAKSQSIPYGHKTYPSGRETQREILLKIKRIMESPSESNETVTTRKLKQLYRSCTNSGNINL
ncbi:EEF1AKMT4-ECE2 readthrough transcript protein [Trichonephila clavipes]|nr:EEF1AKMT4-ECE2 readthrough transcript protein [Trichonephila clavipes]